MQHFQQQTNVPPDRRTSNGSYNRPVSNSKAKHELLQTIATDKVRQLQQQLQDTSEQHPTNPAFRSQSDLPIRVNTGVETFPAFDATSRNHHRNLARPRHEFPVGPDWDVTSTSIGLNRKDVLCLWVWGITPGTSNEDLRQHVSLVSGEPDPLVVELRQDRNHALYTYVQ